MAPPQHGMRLYRLATTKMTVCCQTNMDAFLRAVLLMAFLRALCRGYRHTLVYGRGLLNAGLYLSTPAPRLPIRRTFLQFYHLHSLPPPQHAFARTCAPPASSPRIYTAAYTLSLSRTPGRAFYAHYPMHRADAARHHCRCCASYWHSQPAVVDIAPLQTLPWQTTSHRLTAPPAAAPRRYRASAYRQWTATLQPPHLAGPLILRRTDD